MNAPFSGPTIAIIGGGFTGAAIAYHLVRSLTPTRVVVFEPRPLLGAGLAYSTEDHQHRINVPASKMSLIPGADDHFLRWIERTNAVADDPDARGPDGNLYPRRSVFGHYINSHVAPLVERRLIRHVPEDVVLIKRDQAHWFVQTDSGSAIRADVIVVATTHPPPAAPGIVAKALAGDPRLVQEAQRDTLKRIPSKARLLILGNGLTAADVVASLDAAGHTGPITCLSRRGLRSRGHATAPSEPFGNFTDPPPKSALQLLENVRTQIKIANDRGIPWHAVIDAVRAQAQVFWPQLPHVERARIVRHLRPFWDVHRFRVAPQPENVLDRRIAEGTLAITAGSVVKVTQSAEAINVTLRLRGKGRVVTETFDFVVVTTGPAHDAVLASQTYLAGLSHDGWLQPDGLGLGIACDRRGRAISRKGDAIDSLYIAGPLARGTFGELMGLPQVSDYARQIALNVASDFALSD